MLQSPRAQHPLGCRDHNLNLYSVGRGAGVGRGLGIGAGRGVGVSLGVELGVAVGVIEAVAVAVGVAVGVVVAEAVGVALAVAVGVAVGEAVGVTVAVGVGVGVIDVEPSSTVSVVLAATEGKVSMIPLGHFTSTVAAVAVPIPKCNGPLPCDSNSPPPPPLFSRNAVSPR
jgi:hypothetical protein